MDYKRVIGEAWLYTQSNRALILWYGFIPALMTTTVGIVYFAYQVYVLKEYFSNENSGFLQEVIVLIWEFLRTHVSWTIPLLVIAIFMAIFYLLYPTLAKASAIQMIARNRSGQSAGVGTGLRYGLSAFLPLLEYHIFIKTFAFFSILSYMSISLRWLGDGLFKFLLPIFLIFLGISLILSLLFTYADFFIVIDRHSIFDSMRRSARLVLSHWKHTFLITLLMLIIGIRIIIQAVVIFLIPALVVLITGYITTIAIPVISVAVGGVVGLVSLVTAAYLNGIVDVFSYAVWTYTFLEITAEQEVSAREKVQEILGNHDVSA